MAPFTRRSSSALLVVLVLVPTVTRAHEVEVKGLRDAAARRVSATTPFAADGWTVEGTVLWGPRGVGATSPAALDLSGGSHVWRMVSVAGPRLPEEAIRNHDPTAWYGVLLIDGVGVGPGPVAITAVLTRPDGVRYETNPLSLVGADSMARAVLTIPKGEFTVGDWRLDLRAEGTAVARVVDVSLLLLPADRSQMHFAKSNGPDGPDRIESGALGFSGQTIDDHAPLPVEFVRPLGPADRAGVRSGDLLVGVGGRPLQRSSCKPGWEWFEHGHEAVLGRSVEEAYASGVPQVRLEILRDGQRRVATLILDERLPLPASFPFDDEVTPRLYDELMGFVRRTRNEKGIWSNQGIDWIQTSFAGLSLLGRRDPRDAAAIREIADWFLERFPEPESFGNLGYWSASYAGIYLCEYLLATGDERVRPWIENALAWIASGFHTSKWGTPALGHGPDGLPYDQKALMAPASHVLVFEALARRANVRSAIWEELWPFLRHSWSDPEQRGHGAMGYNGSYRDQEEFWSRTGLCSLAMQLRSEQPQMRRAMTKVMAERHPWMRNSHAYGNPGDIWGLAGLFLADEVAFRAVMKSWRWAFGGAWQPGFGLRHSTAHMGSPYMGEEGLINPAFAMLLACRHRGLFLLGAPERDRGWLRLVDRDIPLSAVLATWNAEGRLLLRPVIPGSKVVYTLDGTPPDARSPVASSPIDLPLGGLVLARTVGTGSVLGPLMRADFALPKAHWKILDATGSADPSDARERAGAWVDGDPKIPWQPDRGEGSPRLPYIVTIDMQTIQRFSGLFFREGGEPSRVAMACGNDLETLASECVASEIPAGSRTLDFGRILVGRYLRLEIHSLVGDQTRFGEVDLRWPEIRIETAATSSSMTSNHTGLVVRRGTNGRPPTKSAPICPETIPLDPGHPTLLRLFDEGGHPVGPVRVVPRAQ